MIDRNKLVEAVGGDDAEIEVVTDWEHVRISVIGGVTRVCAALRTPISRTDLAAAIDVNSPSREAEVQAAASQDMDAIRAQLLDKRQVRA